MKVFIFFGIMTDYSFNIISLILLLIPTIQRVLFDLYVIKIEKQEIDHVAHTVLTAIIMIFLSALNFIIFQIPIWKGLLLSFGIFILIFDYSLNILRGKKWNYIDEGKDGISSLSDGIYKQLGVWPLLFFKIVIFMITFCIYYTWSYIAQN